MPHIVLASSKVLEKGQTTTNFSEEMTELMRQRGLSEEVVENGDRWKLGSKNPLRKNPQ
jgi:hypothetical protein